VRIERRRDWSCIFVNKTTSERQGIMEHERLRRTPLVSDQVADRRTILKSFAAASLAGTMLLERSGAQATTPDPADGHILGDATPQPLGGPAPLRSMLSMIPATAIRQVGGGAASWYYADIAQQFTNLNLHHDADGPDWFGEPWFPGMIALATSTVFQYTSMDELIDAIGFQPLGTDQTMMVGEPPDQITLFRGGLDQRLLEAAWSSSGYVQKALASGATAWTIGEEGEFDIKHPVQNIVFSAFNNLALTGDVLVCAPKMAMLEDVLAVAESGAGSAMDDSTLDAVLSTLPTTTVSAMAVGPMSAAAMISIPMDEAARNAFRSTLEEADAETGPMPANRGLMFGVTAGAVHVDDDLEGAPYTAPDFSAGEGLALVRLIVDAPEDAQQALDVVTYRWGVMTSTFTDLPYADMMELMAAEAVGNVAAFAFAQLRSPAMWRDLVVRRDLAPFAPSL
jgi:hypothetical protein